MTYTNVEMKDGRKYYLPIWKWRPGKGWFTLAMREDLPEHYDDEPICYLYFRDVKTMVTKDENIGPREWGNVDELERARKDGWNGS
jgi:hypothetical protein